MPVSCAPNGRAIRASLTLLDDLGVTVRCIPFDQDGKPGACVLTGKPATQDAIFARAY